ncbi:MAG: hypothetical protein ABI776_11590 [Nocardioidaceae bacterium]
MIEADYTTLVGQAQVDFDRIDGTVATGGSCAAYTQLDQALTQYTAASQYWNGCIADYSCTVSETELNGWWSTASDELDTIDSAGISSLASSGT